MRRVDVAVVGAGPAGLALARALALRGAEPVVVIEREAQAGGIPRHADHQGFGARDLHRLLRGPQYAAHNVAAALAAGAELWTETQATGWSASGALELTSPRGRIALAAGAVVLATGCRERPRSARLIPGGRPLRGVLTTGALQQRVAAGERFDGLRAVVLGSDHVSASAVATLAHAGARVRVLATERPLSHALAAYRALELLRHRVPLLTRTQPAAVLGEQRVECVVLRGSADERALACDLVVFTGDWVPDHELAVLAGAALDPGTRGPRVTTDYMTDRPGLFAVGNVLHGAEPADRVALEGRHAAGAVIAHLTGAPWPAAPVELRCAAPLAWIAPSALAVPRWVAPRRFALTACTPLAAARVTVEQAGRALWSGRLARILPDRPAHLTARWVGAVDPAGGHVTVRAG